MHLVNTIRYMFMSFSEFCFYYYCNDDTVSGNAVSTTDVTRSWREKKWWRFPDISLCCNIWRRSEVVSVLDWGTAQASSNFPIPHTRQFIFLYEGYIYIYYRLTLASWWLNCLKRSGCVWAFSYHSFIRGLDIRPFRHLRSSGTPCYRSRNLYMGLFGFLLKY